MRKHVLAVLVYVAEKYNVPAVGSWIAVELGAGIVQFTLYGALLGWVHRARVCRRPGKCLAVVISSGAGAQPPHAPLYAPSKIMTHA